MATILCGAQVFDGVRLLQEHAVVIDGGRIAGVVPEGRAPAGVRIALKGGVLAPGFVDLQVNGGAGAMVGPGTDLAALRKICAAHIGLGSAGILPTLITDTAEVTAGVIAAGIAASRAAVPGFLGLHLEGPHLDPRRKGAHDPALIRPMDGSDLARLCEAAAALPALMITLAPESATNEQIAALVRAGATVSLGHSDCNHDRAQGAFAAGATCATHLFNAMSQLGNREPGLAGAAMDGAIAAGLIADGIHVHPATLRIAMAANPSSLFLISDAMAFAGTGLTEITLNGRTIQRRDGRLTLPDGTLAGADLHLSQAVQVMVDRVGATVERALAMATSIPAKVIGVEAAHGHLRPGRAANLVHLGTDWRLSASWHAGKATALAI